jgi:hypothetical protein
METRLRNLKMQTLRVSLGFEGLFTVEPVGTGGGLAFFWMNSREVEVLNYSTRHICAQISLEGSDNS